MNIDDWLQWPTKSTDPGVNMVVLVMLVMLAIGAVVIGAVFLVPILVVIGIAKGVHWYVNQPVSTDRLAAQAEQRAIAANFPSTEKFVEAHIHRLLDACDSDLPAYGVYLMMVRISEALYEAEDLNNPLPPLPPANTIEEGRYRDQLLLRMTKAGDAPKTLEVFNAALGEAYLGFIAALPPLAKASPETFFQTDADEPFATFPLLDVLGHPGAAIATLMRPFFADEVQQLALFAKLCRQLERNLYEASGVEFGSSSGKLIMPDAYKGDPQEIVAAYLQGTPLAALFDAPIPFAFSDGQRFEHMHVIGGSGHGKTQLLQHLILHDLQRDEPPALIVIDSQGEMLRKIERLDLFAGRLADKLIVVDPEDVDYPPALNMFDTSNARLGGYSAKHREQIEAGVIELYNYIFGALAAELTQKQGTAFAYVAKLMLAIPGATIHTLRELMEDAAPSLDRSPFAEPIGKLDPTSQAFFQNQFFTKAFAQTKQQIARRLYGVLQVPAFDRMFSARTNKLDLFEAMQDGKVVLINTSKALLKSDASALFGRYMIALTMKAAFERVAVANRRPAFLIVDEAAEYFDESLETLLSQVRKLSLGLLFAHQHLDQLSPALRSSVAANTSIKLAGGVSDRDARTLAADMRSTPDFIAAMKKHRSATEFACFVRNATESAVRLRIPFGALERAPTMNAAEHAALLARNRLRYAASPAAPRPAATGPDRSGQDAPPPPVQADDWRS